jgi:allophanate hydrolase
VVPACASLDCLTVFSRSVDDGAAIMAVMEHGDAGPADVWRRSSPVPLSYSPGAPLQFKFGVPAPEFLEWTGPGERSRGQGRMRIARVGSAAVTQMTIRKCTRNGWSDLLLTFISHTCLLHITGTYDDWL